MRSLNNHADAGTDDDAGTGDDVAGSVDDTGSDDAGGVADKHDSTDKRVTRRQTRAMILTWKLLYFDVLVLSSTNKHKHLQTRKKMSLSNVWCGVESAWDDP